MEWLATYKLTGKFKHILTVPGNHDFIAQQSPTLALRTCAREGIKLLVDSSYEIDGVKFYGSPWQPWFMDWAFNFPKNETEPGLFARQTWSQIPADTSVLITHGPPRGILDKAWGSGPYDTRTGCPYLLERIGELNNLKLHVFGHIHEQNGKELHQDVDTQDVITFVNAAICDRAQYAPIQPFYEVVI